MAATKVRRTGMTTPSPFRLVWVGDRVVVDSAHPFAFHMKGTVAKLAGLGLMWAHVKLDASAMEDAVTLVFHVSELGIEKEKTR